MGSMLGSFGRREVDPKLNKSTFKPSKPVPLAQSPVVARIRKTQFGSKPPTAAPSGINVSEVSKKAAALFAKAPKIQIKRI